MAELITRHDGAVATVLFSNVPKHNAVTYDMWRAFPDVIAGLDRDPSVRAIVLAGDGEKAFISGADISQFEKARASGDAQALYNQAVEAAYEAPVKCTKPVIAKIRGICMGGGLGLAAACDIRLAAADAIFRMPAARLGLGYNFTGLRRFVQILGPANTADIFFSARKFDAADALQIGFVNRVIPVAEFDRTVAEYAALVAENAPLTIAAAKFTIRQIQTDSGERDRATMDTLIARCFSSEDYREGRTAFMEKRTPQFKGK